MHQYWLESISTDRIETLRRAADRRRLVASIARRPAEPLASQLQQRFAGRLPSFGPLAPRPQPCTC
jgi:hypothetical protein